MPREHGPSSKRQALNPSKGCERKRKLVISCLPLYLPRRVAVGTLIAERPPHRSRRALLTHRAPPSGSGVEAVKRQRVQHLDWRKEAIDDANEALSGEVGFLAAPPERL